MVVAEEDHLADEAEVVLVAEEDLVEDMAAAVLAALLEAVATEEVSEAVVEEEAMHPTNRGISLSLQQLSMEVSFQQAARNHDAAIPQIHQKNGTKIQLL